MGQISSIIKHEYIYIYIGQIKRTVKIDVNLLTHTKTIWLTLLKIFGNKSKERKMSVMEDDEKVDKYDYCFC